MLHKKIQVLGLALCVLSLGLVFTASSQPIAPTSDLKSQTTTPPAIDLPYKPEEPVANPDEGESNNPEDSADGETPQGEVDKPVFDWNTLPYIPLKMPVLKSLPDPDF